MTSVQGWERDERQREFRRMVGWSAVAHVCLLGLALVTPRSSSNFEATRVISVDLVALPAPARSASRPPPKAVPAPKPPAEKPPAEKPPPPKPKQTVLPKNAERDPSKPKPTPKEAAPEPQPQEEKALEDLLAEMREEAGEEAPSETPPETPPETTASAPSGVPNAGAGVRVSPEVLAWMRKAKIHVRRAWVVPPGFRAEALETHVVVELDASGAVVGQPRIVRRSGNPWFDEGVVRGIEKSSPLPPPPRAGEWDFVFLPEDAY